MGNKFTAPYSAPSHTPGTPKGEEQIENLGKEPGRDDPSTAQRTTRDSTSVNPQHQAPIDDKMPYFPPA